MKNLSKQDRKILDKALERFKAVQEHEHDLREVAEDDFCFAAGDQWPYEAKRDREVEDRPVLTINRLPQFISQVVGDARQNKPTIKALPVDSNSDPDTAKVYEGLIRQIETSSKAHEAYLTGLEHAATGGWGHWRVVTQYSDDTTFNQDIRIKRIVNPFSVYWDPSAREYDRSDARWCFVTEWISKEVFKERYPNQEPDDWKAEAHDCQDWIDNKDDQVRIAEYWVKEDDSKTLALLETGETVDITDIDPPEGTVRTRQVKCDKVCRYVLSGHAVLEKKREWPGKHIPIIPVWGPEEYVNGDVRPRSVIRYAKDAQQQYNFWQSQITEKIMLAPRSPWLVTTKQIEGLERFWNAANEENRAYLPYNPDPQADPPQRNSPATVSQSELAQSAQAIEDMKGTTGIYDAGLGNQSNEKSGVAINARKMQSDSATFAWIDNLSRSITRTGQILVDLIPRIYDTQRTVRILGVDDESEFVPINQYVRDENGEVQLLHDLTVGKYDVRVMMGPSYATQRQEAAESLMQFIKAVPQAGQVAADLIAKNMDWPGSEELAERLEKMLPQGLDEDSPPPQPSPMEQLQLQQAQLELRKMQAETAKAEADAGYTSARAQSELVGAQKTQVETQTHVAQADHDMRKQDAEIQKIAAETAKIVTDTLIQQGVINDPAKVSVNT